MLLRLETFFDRFSHVMGWIAGVLNLAMLFNVFYDAITRYFFNTGSIAMQEMEWHLFAMVFLFGIAYALKEDGHVRVDVLYDRFSPRWHGLVPVAVERADCRGLRLVRDGGVYVGRGQR